MPENSSLGFGHGLLESSITQDLLPHFRLQVFHVLLQQTIHLLTTRNKLRLQLLDGRGRSGMLLLQKLVLLTLSTQLLDEGSDAFMRSLRNLFLWLLLGRRWLVQHWGLRGTLLSRLGMQLRILRRLLLVL